MKLQVLKGMSDKQERFKNLVRAHSQSLYRYAFWLTKKDSDAQDLVQETFARAWKSLDSLRDEGAVKSWLTIILRREFVRKVTANKIDIVDDYDGDVDDFTLDVDHQNKSDDQLWIREALMQLPLKFREPLLMQVYMGFSLDEIAEKLELPANTVATRLHRARQKLRKLLTDSDVQKVNSPRG